MIQILPDGSVVDDALTGAGVGLTLANLANPNASAAAKGFGAAGLTPLALRGAGAVGVPGASEAAGPVGGAVAAAGLGYGLSQIASDSDLSTKRKIGHSSLLASDIVQTLIPYYGPYYATFLAEQAITGMMKKSGSPQVREAGRVIDFPLSPVEGLRSVLSGDTSPRGAFRGMVDAARGMFGLSTKPTTGTMFRRELGSIFDKMGIKGAKMDAYNVDLSQFTQQEIDSANRIAGHIVQFSPTARANPKNQYQTQIAGILLNSFGKRQQGGGSTVAVGPLVRRSA